MHDKNYERYKHLGGVRDNIASDFGITQGNILDIATGDAFFAIAFAKRLQQGKVIGIDNIKEHIKDAKQNIKELQDKCELQVKNFFKNEFQNESFDIITTFLGVCDLAKTQEQLEKVFTEIKRLLKPKGRLLIAEATPEDAENESQKIGFEIHQKFFYKYFSKEELKETLKGVGFKDITISFYDTKQEKISDNDLKEFLKDESKFCEIDHNMAIDWKQIYEKYKDKIDNPGIEFDGKITVITAAKTS
ncbi:MAG: class I SAM-dependent methyltransferase [Nanoarchaeota archaeon]|nr:class I SAM-dependent methyltransferase [Nanoarchaeota archaeon]